MMGNSSRHPQLDLDAECREMPKSIKHKGVGIVGIADKVRAFLYPQGWCSAFFRDGRRLETLTRKLDKGELEE